MPNEHFCLAFILPSDYDYYEDEEGSTSNETDVTNSTQANVTDEIEMDVEEKIPAPYYVVCIYEEEDVNKDFKNIFYPTALLISAFFILITIAAYIYLEELHAQLFGKITIGFVLNNLLAYLCLAIVYIGKKTNMEKMRVGTIGCVVMGYLTLYTFTSFMLWINAMAANIFFKFSSIMSGAGAPSNGWRKIILYALYTQVTRSQI